MAYAFHLYYCEENVWHLCRHADVAERERRVVLITNARRTVPMWGQRVAPTETAPVLWDYHVILLVAGADSWEAWDLNARLAPGAPFAGYMAATFPQWERLPGPLQPRFRVLTPSAWEEAFSSDRSHMRDADGAFRAPPPPWPPIHDPAKGMTLPALLDCARPSPGTWLSLADFIGRFGGAPGSSR